MTVHFSEFNKIKYFYIFICFCLLFFNYYNPVSVYVTLLFNVTVLSFFLFVKKNTVFKIDVPILFLTSMVLSWVNILVIYHSHDDFYVIGKYFRVFFSTILLMLVFCHLKVNPRNFVRLVSVIFLLHVFSVALQTAFPQISVPMASFFGMSSPENFFTEYSLRKMGLSSSFDTSSLISVLSMIFFFMYFNLTKNRLLLVFAFFSFLACGMSSRTGMILGGMFFLYFGVSFILRGRRGSFVFAILFITILSAYLYVLTPIILYSFGYEASTILASEYGATGISGLTGSHLEPLGEVSFSQLFFGLGYDPDRTDIGYVKLLYHAGAIGSFIILLLYLYMLVNAWNFKFPDEPYAHMLKNFFIVLLAVVFVMNYKSLEIYSRGTHDFILMNFFYLASLRFRAAIRFALH